MALLLRHTQQIKEWSTRSLPSDPIDAQRLYQEWLTELALTFDFDKLKIAPGRRVSGREKLFTSVYVSLEGESELSQLLQFLELFDRVELAHRIDDLVIKPLGTKPTDRMHFILTAEGLSFTTATPRSFVFPETVLDQNLAATTGESTATVRQEEGFPRTTPFQARLGLELVTVAARDGHNWTIRRGEAGTRVRSHQAGTRLQLLPLRNPDSPPTLDRLAAILAASPFALSTPQSTEPSRPEPPPTVTSTPPADTTARDTYLIASVEIDGARQAWLMHRGRGERAVVTAGSSIQIGTRSMVVKEVGADSLVLQEGAEFWRMPLGTNFEALAPAAMTKTEESAAGAFVPAEAQRPDKLSAETPES